MIMRTIQDNAEKSLIETAGLCAKMQMPVRCLYVPLSLQAHTPQMIVTPDEVIRNLSDALVAANIEAMIYICQDHDVFILSRQLNRKIWDRIVETLPHFILSGPERDLIKLLELHVDHQVVIRLCQDKLTQQAQNAEAAQQAQQQAQEEKRQATERAMDMDIALNQGLIASLASRRHERKAPGILVVEDDPFSQKLVSNALRQEYEVYSAMSGREAIQAIIKNAPDMIFLDIGLPDVTGLSILDEIFTIDPAAHVVMLSGNGSRDNVIGAIQKGAKDFIGKPFTIDKLRQALAKNPFITAKHQKKVGQI